MGGGDTIVVVFVSVLLVLVVSGGKRQLAKADRWARLTCRIVKYGKSAGLEKSRGVVVVCSARSTTCSSCDASFFLLWTAAAAAAEARAATSSESDSVEEVVTVSTFKEVTRGLFEEGVVLVFFIFPTVLLDYL